MFHHSGHLLFYSLGCPITEAVVEEDSGDEKLPAVTVEDIAPSALPITTPDGIIKPKPSGRSFPEKNVVKLSRQVLISFYVLMMLVAGKSIWSHMTLSPPPPLLPAFYDRAGRWNLMIVAVVGCQRW